MFSLVSQLFVVSGDNDAASEEATLDKQRNNTMTRNKKKNGRKPAEPKGSWHWLLAPDGSPAMGETSNIASRKCVLSEIDEEKSKSDDNDSNSDSHSEKSVIELEKSEAKEAGEKVVLEIDEESETSEVGEQVLGRGIRSQTGKSKWCWLLDERPTTIGKRKRDATTSSDTTESGSKKQSKGNSSWHWLLTSDGNHFGETKTTPMQSKRRLRSASAKNSDNEESSQSQEDSDSHDDDARNTKKKRTTRQNKSSQSEDNSDDDDDDDDADSDLSNTKKKTRAAASQNKSLELKENSDIDDGKAKKKITTRQNKTSQPKEDSDIDDGAESDIRNAKKKRTTRQNKSSQSKEDSDDDDDDNDDGDDDDDDSDLSKTKRRTRAAARQNKSSQSKDGNNIDANGDIRKTKKKRAIRQIEDYLQSKDDTDADSNEDTHNTKRKTRSATGEKESSQWKEAGNTDGDIRKAEKKKRAIRQIEDYLQSKDNIDDDGDLVRAKRKTRAAARQTESLPSKAEDDADGNIRKAKKKRALRQIEDYLQSKDDIVDDNGDLRRAERKTRAAARQTESLPSKAEGDADDDIRKAKQKATNTGAVQTKRRLRSSSAKSDNEESLKVDSGVDFHGNVSKTKKETKKKGTPEIAAVHVNGQPRLRSSRKSVNDESLQSKDDKNVAASDDTSDNDDGDKTTSGNGSSSSTSTSTSTSSSTSTSGGDNDLKRDHTKKRRPQGVFTKVWEGKFQLLVDYKKEHGHTRVPDNNDESNLVLSNWVRFQRQRYDMGTLPQERIDRLESIGFEWKPGHFKPQMWMKMYNQLVAYKEKYGTTCVPHKWEENVQLANWVYRQRRECTLEERRDLLNKIGFVWDPNESQWMTRYNQLVEYKKKYGTSSVPSRWKENIELGNWVRHQRNCCVDKDRVDLLNAIGFDWDPTTSEWMARYHQLVEYKKKHGTTRVGESKNPSLSRWVVHQRHGCKERWRLDLLNNIDFDWST